MMLGDAALGITRESRCPSRRLAVAIALLGLAFLLAPRLEGWPLLHVHKEDGVIFLSGFVNHGWSSLWEPYTGYQHLVPRSIAGVCASGPTSWFASCVGVGASFVRVALALVAFAVLAPYARSATWAAVAASTFIWAPVGQQEALGNLTNLRWFLDAGAVVILLGVWRRPWMIAVVAITAVGAALTDPLAAVVAPLALWRLLVLSGRERVVPAAFLVATAVHFALLDRSARSSEASYLDDPAGFAQQVGVRGVSVPWFGQNGTEVLLMIGAPAAVIAGLVVVGLVSYRQAWSPVLALALLLAVWGGGLLVVTLTFTDMVSLGLDPAWRLGQGSRYSVPPGVLVTMGLLLVIPPTLARATGLWRLGLLGLVAALPLAVIADMPGDPANTAEPTWAAEVDRARQSCETGKGAVRVQMTPANVPLDWSVDLACDWLVR